MRSAAWLVALFSIVVGIVGLVSPDTGMAIRREYLSTPVGLLAAGAVRFAMGVVLILAPASRAPKILRAIGVLMCAQALASFVIGTPERARAIVDWEAALGHAVLRVGAVIALATGCFIVFATTGRRAA